MAGCHSPAAIRLCAPSNAGAGAVARVESVTDQPDLFTTAGKIADLRSRFQEAVVDVLIEKARRALAATGLGRLAVVGGLAANSRLRDRMADKTKQIFDLRYQDLMDDPLGTVAAIYAHWELPLTDQARQRMHAYLEQNPHGGHGKHEYSFADTGLDLDEERAKFISYQARFDVPSEV